MFTKFKILLGGIAISVIILAPVKIIAQQEITNIEFVPQWAKSAIWYQIFPERFRNGDPLNDPTLIDIIGAADTNDLPKVWHVHPWGSDWYELQSYEIENGYKKIDKNLLNRRYGGDLQGIIDKLDYLKDLGINAIYLTPVFDAPSLHKYDGACYHHVDPNFGPDPTGDRLLTKNEDPLKPETWAWTKADERVLTLIHEAHRRNIRIIFDGVFNHMGRTSFAFKDLIKNQEKSPYKDWFTVKSWDNPEAGTKFDYVGWFGNASLPELREDSTGMNPGASEYIFNATNRWMNPKNAGIENGIDGWRLDVAFCIGHPFWKKWRKHVKSINPNAYLTAEIVKTTERTKPYLQGDEFDGEMNYNFAFACAEFFFNTDSTRIVASLFDKKLSDLRNTFPNGVAEVTQNLFDSHDANRIGSHIVNCGIGNYRNWGKYFNLSIATKNPSYNVRKPNKEEIELQKLFVIFQMTYVGAPMVYYGDEVGMWGGNDPDCRKPMIWPDIKYQNERYKPDGTIRPTDTVAINYDLLAHYKKLISIRNTIKALQLGDYKTLLMDDASGLYAFQRTYQGQEVIVIINNSSLEQKAALPVDKSSTWIDVLNENKIVKEMKSISIKPKWGAILMLK